MVIRLVLAITTIFTIFHLTFAAIPTGCVVLINADHNKYLDRAELVDQLRRRVVPGIDPSQVWDIVRRDQEYRIKVRGRVNELFATSGQQADPERRSVFVWEPAWEEAKEGAWDIKELTGGKYSIRNVEFNEFLYLSRATGKIQTWIPKNIAPKDDASFQWDILPC